MQNSVTFVNIYKTTEHLPMRKSIITAALALLFSGAWAQDIQVHYDLGKTLYDDLGKRPAMTTTAEMFKPDRWGSTFFFIDLDYGHDGVAGTYWEIYREMSLTKNKQWAAHIEYNGGMSSDKDTYEATRFQHAVLFGPAWNWVSKDYKRNFSVQVLYKYYFKGQHSWNRPYSGIQLTEVWGTTFAKGLCTFSGYCDLWYDKKVNGNFILQSEPQFWFNLNTLRGWDGINLSLGSEVEISNNFVFNSKGQNNKFYAIPTVAAKWTF